MFTFKRKFNTLSFKKCMLENRSKKKKKGIPEVGSYFQGTSLSLLLQECKCLPKQEGEVCYAQ